MAWETRNGRGRYYTRSRKINGRAVREYVGGGLAGELAAETDAHDRAERAAARTHMRDLAAERAALAAPLATLHAATEALAQAALVTAGYHRHHRGEWRKRRDSTNRDGAGEA